MFRPAVIRQTWSCVQLSLVLWFFVYLMWLNWKKNVSPLNWHIFAGVPDKDMAAMELGLAHSLSRYKLKFSPDKIDTMIVQVARVLRPLTFLR
jgi:hypothetical protein